MTKTRFVEVGAWTTLERFWGSSGRAVFVRPVRAEVKVRYGSWLGQDRQRQTLDGLQPRELKVGFESSIAYARMQIIVPRSVEVTYELKPR